MDSWQITTITGVVFGAQSLNRSHSFAILTFIVLVAPIRDSQSRRLRDSRGDGCRPAPSMESWIIVAAISGIAVGYIFKRLTERGASA